MAKTHLPIRAPPRAGHAPPTPTGPAPPGHPPFYLFFLSREKINKTGGPGCPAAARGRWPKNAKLRAPAGFPENNREFPMLGKSVQRQALARGWVDVVNLS